MGDIRKIFLSTFWLFLAVVSFTLTWILYSIFYAPDFKSEISEFQAEINKVESELKTFNKRSFETLKKSSVRQLWLGHDFENDRSFQTYVMLDDSLVYWSDNKTEIENVKSDFSDLLQLSNGYYLVQQKMVGNLRLLNTVLIQSNYPYENDELRNKLASRLQLPQELSIEVNRNKGAPIFNLEKEYLFSLKLTGGKNTTPGQELLIFSVFLFGVLSLLLGFGRILYGLEINRTIKFWSYTILLLSIRFFTLRYQWSEVFADFDIYGPEIYASSFVSPNLGEFCINIIAYILLGWWVLKFLEIRSRFLVYFLFVLTFVYAFVIANVLQNLITNSSIPLRVEELFNLNRYSFVVLVGVFILFYVYLLFVRKVVRQLKNLETRLTSTSVLWFVLSVFYLLLGLFVFNQAFLLALLPSLIIGFLLYVEFKYNGQYTFGLSIVVLALFSFYASLTFGEYNQKNEYQTRELYANQLASDYDPNVELEYSIIRDDYIRAEAIAYVYNHPNEVRVSDFKSRMEDLIFNDFWERYDVSFYIFTDSAGPLLESPNRKENELDQLINKLAENKNGEGIFYVESYRDKISYVAREKIDFGKDELTIYATFRSKRIPEKIGFPRLLINEKANVLEELEEYSMAKYVLGTLVTRFNDYNYPVDENTFLNSFEMAKGFVEDEEYSHFIYNYNEVNTLVLTKRKVTKLSVFTTFSYLFTFFACLLIFPWFIRKQKKSVQFGRLNLSVKIQFVLISLVLVSLIVFGLVAGSFVKAQYNSYTNDNIQEKIYSVNTEVKQKLGDREKLSKEELGNYMEYILQKFSGVFVTDINLFALDGELLASSQPKIYRLGLINTIIHPHAYRELKYKKRSEYIHNENIGELNYLSAYIPFVNNNGDKLAFLNLQYFAKQNDYEEQISSFLVSIINLAVLLIVSTIVIAIFISNWITSPLKLIQRNFSSVELGKTTQPIDYAGDDEIGALVRDYNAKLAELEIKALQLAKSERESAWREMAKQVAHEIKNPLTPMKLRLQHFQRAFDPNDERSKDKLTKMVTSLIEQIDALTNIANEFSNFAKMPKPEESLIDLVPLIKNCLNLFKQTPELSFSAVYDKEQFMVYADKNLMLRVFNNLIKNAIQAIPEDQKGQVSVHVRAVLNDVIISVSDTGVGIPEDKLNKIFVPNFTTKSTGTGLGLAMVKQIIENHNGEIWFDTKVGVGTSFYVKLPLRDNALNG